MKTPTKLKSTLSETGAVASAIVMFLCLVLAGPVISSFPSSYLFDFTASQIKGCSVRVENPILRTLLGSAGMYGGGVGYWGAAIAKVAELSMPSTQDVFNGPRCP